MRRKTAAIVKGIYEEKEEYKGPCLAFNDFMINRSDSDFMKRLEDISELTSRNAGVKLA